MENKKIFKIKAAGVKAFVDMIMLDDKRHSIEKIEYRAYKEFYETVKKEKIEEEVVITYKSGQHDVMSVNATSLESIWKLLLKKTYGGIY